MSALYCTVSIKGEKTRSSEEVLPYHERESPVGRHPMGWDLGVCLRFPVSRFPFPVSSDNDREIAPGRPADPRTIRTSTFRRRSVYPAPFGARQVHASNTLGGVNPVDEVAEAAHAVGAKVLVDGCQSVPNMPVDVQVQHAGLWASFVVRRALLISLMVAVFPRWWLVVWWEGGHHAKEKHWCYAML